MASPTSRSPEDLSLAAVTAPSQVLDGLAAAAAALLHAGPRAAAILARLGGVAGDAARGEAARLGALDRPARVRSLASRVAQLRSSVPVGLPLVHRDWIDAALTGEGAHVRGILDGTAPVPARVKVWVERRIYGGIVAIPLPSDPAALTPVSLAHRPPAAIEALLRRAGLLTLALALTGLDDAAAGDAGGPGARQRAVAAIAARLGRDGAALVEAVADVTSPTAVPFGTRRAAARRAAGVAIGDDPLALVAMGARAAAPHLVGTPARQVAQRLPRRVGLRVLAEVAAFAAASDGPSWEALARGADRHPTP